MDKSKSLFYHLCADLEIFTAALLDRHLVRARSLAERERQCQALAPGLVDLLVASNSPFSSNTASDDINPGRFDTLF